MGIENHQRWGKEGASSEMGIENRDAKRRKKCPSRHTRNSGMHSSDLPTSPAHSLVCSQGDGAERCGDVRSAERNHQGLEADRGQVLQSDHVSNSTETAASHSSSASTASVEVDAGGVDIPGANVFSDISECVLSDPQVREQGSGGAGESVLCAYVSC